MLLAQLLDGGLVLFCELAPEIGWWLRIGCYSTARVLLAGHCCGGSRWSSFDGLSSIRGSLSRVGFAIGEAGQESEVVVENRDLFGRGVKAELRKELRFRDHWNAERAMNTEAPVLIALSSTHARGVWLELIAGHVAVSL